MHLKYDMQLCSLYLVRTQRYVHSSRPFKYERHNRRPESTQKTVLLHNCCKLNGILVTLEVLAICLPTNKLPISVLLLIDNGPAHHRGFIFLIAHHILPLPFPFFPCRKRLHHSGATFSSFPKIKTSDPKLTSVPRQIVSEEK